MPQGGRMGRALAKSQGAFITPIVTNNPAFQVKMLNVDDRLEQQAGTEKRMKDNFKVGDVIIGTEFNKKDKHRGKITKLVKDSEGKLNSYMIDDEDGDTIKIDPTTAERLDLHDTGGNSKSGENFALVERTYNYEGWKRLMESRNNKT